MLQYTILCPSADQLSAPPAEVMRLLGYREGRTRLAERDVALVERGIRLAREASRPMASVAYCAVTVDCDKVRTPLPGVAWRSRSLARLLDGADGVSLLAATLGPGVEELTRSLFDREEYALATIVDAAGSALVQGLGEWLRTELAGPAGGARLTPLYGPGYGDWPIEEQIALVDLAGGQAIGLTCTETCYLQPQKSLVGLVGWLPAGAGRGLALPGCVQCTMANCAYRVRREVPGSA